MSGDNHYISREISDYIARGDICMSPGLQKCGDNHNTEEFQVLTTDVLIDFMTKCPNFKIIVLFGQKPNIPRILN